jgi:transposase
MHRIVKKTKVASEPEALGNSFGVPGITVKQIGVEAGPLLQWLHAGLKRAGFDAILLETRHVKAALSAMTVKTDPQRCARTCATDAHGKVPSSACQIDGITGGMGAAGCASSFLDGLSKWN